MHIENSIHAVSVILDIPNAHDERNCVCYISKKNLKLLKINPEFKILLEKNHLSDYYEKLVRVIFQCH